ncbi:MAG: hypothetical protein ACKOA8_05720, partial [Deltaproteobacteria bacterium]
MPSRPQPHAKDYEELESTRSSALPQLNSLPTPVPMKVRTPKPTLSFPQKLVLLLIFLLGILFSSTCYSEGTSVLSVAPQSHSLGRFWENTKTAQLKTLAMLIEMYPDYELYFLDRDARLLGQTGLVISQVEKEPGLQNRIHFLNVSRANLKDPLLNEYLEQEGISEKSLSSGKKILFIDTGFQASIPRLIMSRFPNYEESFGVHMLVASPYNSEYRSPFPSTRVFGTEFNAYYPESDDLYMGEGIVHRYATLPKSETRSDFFLKTPDGKIIPSASEGSKDVNDGIISVEKTRIYEADLQHFMRREGSRLLLSKLRRQWRNARTLWEQGKKPELIKELKSWIQIKGAAGLAMALDFMEINHTNLVGHFTVTPDDLE